MGFFFFFKQSNPLILEAITTPTDALSHWWSEGRTKPPSFVLTFHLEQAGEARTEHRAETGIDQGLFPRSHMGQLPLESETFTGSPLLLEKLT